MMLRIIFLGVILNSAFGLTGLVPTPNVRVMDVCKQAALRAGDVILAGSKAFDLASGVIAKQGSRDIVTEYDKMAQQDIRDVIHQAFPDHRFLGEEDILPGRDAASAAIARLSEAEHLWMCVLSPLFSFTQLRLPSPLLLTFFTRTYLTLTYDAYIYLHRVDPIDGTTNFAHGMPLAGVIIAYCSRGTVLFGCIYDPFRKEMFTAWRGQGAFLNDVAISCCSTQELQDSVVCTGSPPNIDSLNACLRATNLISAKVRTVRMIGSAAIMLAWVAMGRCTAYFEADMHVWDIAAGALIIQEAGGRVTDVWGGEYKLQTRNFVSSNGLVHDKLLAHLIKAEMYI